MSDGTVAIQARRRRTLAVRFGLVLLIALLVLIKLLAAKERPLKPLRPASPPASFQETNGQPLLMGFGELRDDPFVMQGRRLRMTGQYTPLETTDCRNYKGPVIAWSIVAEDLQLNATGYEAVLKPLPEGTVLTIDGIWRLYDGPLGCGKEPPPGTVWYLEVGQIVQPNPLFGNLESVQGTAADLAGTSALDGTPTPGLAGDVVDGGSDGRGTIGAPGLEPTPSIGTTSPLATLSPTRSGTTATPLSATESAVSATPSAASSPATSTPPAPGSATPTPTSFVGATATPTPVSGTGSTSTPFPTAPPLVTSTVGGGYPGPSGTPTPTGTPGSYP